MVQAFNVNGSERVNGQICFQLQVVMGTFLVKHQAFTVNSSEGF